MVDTDPVLAAAVLDRPEVLTGLTLEVSDDFLDGPVLEKIIGMNDAATLAKLTAWTEESPLRVCLLENGSHPMEVKRQILSCTATRMGYVSLAHREVQALRTIHLPPGLTLREVALQQEQVQLHFTFGAALSHRTGVPEGTCFRAMFKLEELFGGRHSSFEQMAFSSPDAPDPLRDYVNVLIFLKRAGYDAPVISPESRSHVLSREDVPYSLRIELPLNYRVVTPSHRSGAGTFQVVSLVRKTTSPGWDAVLYVGAQPRLPFTRLPDESTEREGRLSWRAYTHHNLPYMRAEIQADNGPPAYIVLAGQNPAEMEMLFSAFDALEILPLEQLPE